MAKQHGALYGVKGVNNMLFDVNVSLLIDAESREDAMRKSSEFLAGNISPDLNYLVNDAEPDDNFASLEALRNKSNLTKRAADLRQHCGHHAKYLFRLGNGKLICGYCGASR